MANSSFSGPVRSKNGFIHLSELIPQQVQRLLMELEKVVSTL